MDRTEQVELETLIDVFDKAMTSDSPAVRAALKELILAVALTTGEGREHLVDGPLRKLMLTLHRLESKINDMERKQWTAKVKTDWDQAKRWTPPSLDSYEN